MADLGEQAAPATRESWTEKSDELEFDRCMLSWNRTRGAWETRAIRYGAWGVDDEKWLSQIRSIYNTKFLPKLREVKSTEEEVADNGIPKILHHIWLGGELPPHFQLLRQGWIEKHLGWRCLLWDDATVAAELDSGRIDCRAALERASNVGEKSDILRLHLLLRYGGVYVDVDFACVRSLEPLRASQAGCVCALSNVGYLELNNGVIGSKAGHGVVGEYVRALEEAPSALRSSVLSLHNNTIAKTGPGRFTSVVGSYLQRAQAAQRGGGEAEEGGGEEGGDLDLVVLPWSFFYPLPNTDRAASASHAALDPEHLHALEKEPAVFAAHLWACSWQEAESGLSAAKSADNGEAKQVADKQGASPSRNDVIWLANLAARGKCP